MGKTLNNTTALDSEKIYRQVLEYSLDSTVIHSDYSLLFINEAGSELLRGSKDAFCGFCILDFFEDDHFKQLMQERIISAHTTKEPVPVLEAAITRLDGTRFDAEIHSRQIQYGDRDVIQTIFRDITKQKEAERWMKDKDKLASVGQIAAGIAHEVKNPLTAVKGFLQLLEESYTHPYLTTMKSELNIAINTLTNLLHVSKPDLYEEEIVPIYLCKELDALLLLFQDRFYDIEVEMHLKDASVFILGKRNLFLKAFFNLFKNAIEAISGSGKIIISHYVEEGMVHVKIRDSGVGIPKDKINILGTPFYSSKNEGTGLGLTQVFTTIFDHGGSVSVCSEVGKGTTFHIKLPFNQ
ncbi:ATP-binding protein [Jeotgalibacillus proteolyticus]|uniref:histidine kinase n=1 Tax=Jeotgalibacillus proteolyticus TaxID=2082395 RepID=A0A2S5GCM3_9BACL|nr:ATP-binding protein [Jeotgalibacillus proteolyticus]PPA70750.1 PAS domain-containing sensor histidine kinase [Jeotgalibacillus proteolyticus]